MMKVLEENSLSARTSLRFVLHPERQVRPVKIAGIGSYVPERILTNADLERMVETSDEWIVTRTGIRERRIADPSQATSDLALLASQQALERAQVSPKDLDLILVPTITPDMIFPCTASLLQNALGATSAGAFDLSSGCTGFLYGLAVASGLIASGMAENILVVAAECLSRIVNWKDRNTCVLFGDGAGAAVLQPSEDESQILGFELGSDGSGGDLLKIPAGGSRNPITPERIAEGQHYLHMCGNEVFRFAVRVIVEASQTVMDRCGVTPEEVDHFIPHQANIRIIDSAVQRLRFPQEKVVVNVDRYGNTSAASVPLALSEAVESGRVKKGDLILMVAFGAGLSWASALVRW